MDELNEEQRRKLVVQYKNGHSGASSSTIVSHFMDMGMPRSTVYAILKNYSESATINRKVGSGRPSTLICGKSKRNILMDALANKTISQRKMAVKYGISQAYVNKIMRENGVKAYKKCKVPASTEEQKEKQTVRIDKLYRHLCGHNLEISVVMDDESYFSLSHSRLPGNAFYYATACGDAPVSSRHVQTMKFEPKIMVSNPQRIH